MDNDKVINILNELIETCRDGQIGFKEAAENAQSPDLRTFFKEESLERAQLCGELQQHILALGGDPENGGSTSGAIHRAWINIKGTLTGKNDHAILNEVERGEDSAIEAFKDALQEGLPANIRLVIENQFREVKRVHDRVKQMRDARSASAGRRP